MILETVDTLQEISKTDFQNKYFKPQKPLLIKGFAKQWTAYDK